MSCNGCRVLRKGCVEDCVLRPCLQWIETAEAQGHAVIFLAKFFGRAGLISFISAVPENQRQALFQSLLFEGAGRTVNPVNGAVGLLWTGNWHVCQAAVETVLRGGALKPIPQFFGAGCDSDDVSECTDIFKIQDPRLATVVQKRCRLGEEPAKVMQLSDLDLSLTPRFHGGDKGGGPLPLTRRVGSPSSMNSEESVATTCGDRPQPVIDVQLLNLFN